eukprot:8876991-Karenia_brevis.AAC.1
MASECASKSSIASKPATDHIPYQIATPQDAGPNGLPLAAPSNCAHSPHYASGSSVTFARNACHPINRVLRYAPASSA